MNFSSRNDVSCGSADHWARRRVLKAAGLSGLSWLTPMADQLALAADLGKTARPRSVILVWLQGGASQLETFDPHPGKTIAYGSGAVDTPVKGIQLGEKLVQTAELMEDFSLIRSVVSKEGDHARATYNIKTGHRLIPGLEHPSVGAIVCHELEDPKIDIPTHISIIPANFAARGGYLGAHFDAFQIGDPNSPVPDVASRVSEKRTKERLESLSVLEESFAKGRLANLDRNRTQHITNLERARRMMTSDQLAAFDVSQETKADREAFGDSPFGRGCLAAVRLIECGVRCVEVTLNGWDTHANNRDLQNRKVELLDPALASLIRTLKARDLYEETIVICATEFGRTPKQNVAEGRDHWPHGFSILLGGGGLAGGKVIGETDPEGDSKDPANPVDVEDVHATVYEALGIDYEFELPTPINRPVPISEGVPVRELLVG
ncbi:MAG: DUF1501 domain-containing protein [Verrucomicrobiales bacterium]|nr:DUF1501 domain-containing protein [Verrucomicrobiales bacterium]